MPRLPNPQRRSERAQRAILTAAFSLCSEQGYGKLTVEGVAAEAGVGKQTIYRWWHSKAAVVLDALIYQVGASLDFPETGDTAADIRSQMQTVARLMSDPAIGPAYAGLIADSQHDPLMATTLYERLIGPRLQACGERLAIGQAAGQIATGIDLEIAAELLYGPLYHRLLLGSGPLNRGFIKAIVDLVLVGLRSPAGWSWDAAAGRPWKAAGLSWEAPAAPLPQAPGPPVPPGPRSRQAILSAAYELCRTSGFHALTMDAIAARAGVGKQTLYRWWPSKREVVLDALLDVMHGESAYPDTGDIRADLCSRLSTLVPLYTSAGFGPIYVGLIASAQLDIKLAADLRERLIVPRMAACQRRLERAQRQGQIDRSADPRHIVELLYGAVHHRLLLHGRPLAPGYVQPMVDLAFAGVAAR